MMATEEIRMVADVVAGKLKKEISANHAEDHKKLAEIIPDLKRLAAFPIFEPLSKPLKRIYEILNSLHQPRLLRHRSPCV